VSETWNQNLDRLIDLLPDRADSGALRRAMVRFLKAWSDLTTTDEDMDKAVKALARAIRCPVAKVRPMFASFRQMAGEDRRESYARFKENYLGTTQHLRFGHLVGKVLGLDPVLGGLLSPHGGLVGPGHLSVHLKGGVLGYHGIAHDGGGYLCSQHGIGPGYEYVLTNRDRSGDKCERSPLAGQVTGIAFWFRLLSGRPRRLIAGAELSPALAAPGVGLSQDVTAFMATEAIPERASELPASVPAEDGVVLDRAELLCLRSLLTGEEDKAQAETVAEGFQSLQDRRLITVDDQGGFVVDDELVLLFAVATGPELQLAVTSVTASTEPERSLAAVGVPAGDEERSFCYYQWEEFIVEQTYPTPEHVRLAGLRDAAQAQDRLMSVLPVEDSGFQSLALVLTNDQVRAAVAAADAGNVDLAASMVGGDLVAVAEGNEARADLATALASSRRVGTLEITRYEERQPVAIQRAELIRGDQATWLLRRDLFAPEQVVASLALPDVLIQAFSPTADANEENDSIQ
jgi:hypothetical protein